MNAPDLSTRRHFLAKNAMGISSLASAWLLQRDRAFANTTEMPPLENAIHDLLAKPPVVQPKAEAMISIFTGGGPSHLDLFDHKPALDQYAGKQFPGEEIKYDNAGQATSIVMPSKWKFNRCGESGMEINDTLLPHFAEIVDEVCLIRSMNLPDIRNHVAGMRAMTTGRGPEGFPSLGSWLTYGLGAESDNLPAFVALVLGRNPPGSPFWDSRQLPSIYQGTVVRETEPRIANLRPPTHLKGEAQNNQLELLDRINRRHLDSRPGEDDLAARIASYELAARMQTEASDALDISGEAEATRKLYGLDDNNTRRMGEACLLARRLVERGVRFVQIWNYAWDMHANIFSSLERACAGADQPAAALVKDLKGRGLLDTTLVQWGGEMGRLPVVQDRGAGQEPGRDHNTEGFSIWMAGGGLRKGHVHGATDDFGHRAVVDPVTQHDLHATLLERFGLQSDELSYHYSGRDVALVEKGQGKVVEGILA